MTLPRQVFRSRLRIAAAVAGAFVLLVTLVTVGAWAFGGGDPEARVEIISVPPGASVTLDGQPLPGVTPLLIEDGLDPARRQEISVTLAGYHPWQSTTDGRAQQMAVLDRLRATLQVSTQPPGAHVWVDQVLYGSAPISVPNLDIGREIEIRASKVGYDNSEQTITISVEDLEPSLTLTLATTPDPDAEP